MNYALLLTCLLALAGCAKEPPPKPGTPPPKVTGDEVSFAAGSPQLDSITIGTAQPRTVATPGAPDTGTAL